MTTSRRPLPWMKLAYLAPGISLPRPYDGSGAMSGQLLVSCVALSTAPLARKSVMWLVRLKLPVSHVPAGTCSVVPPRRRWCWMRYTALRNAHVFTVRPSPTPPNSVMDTTSGRCFAGATPTHVAAAAASVPWSSTASAASATARPRNDAAMLMLACSQHEIAEETVKPSRGLQEELFLPGVWRSLRKRSSANLGWEWNGMVVGAASEVRHLHESGEFRRVLVGAAPAPPAPCASCGGSRFTPCGAYGGSHRRFSEKTGGFHICAACNENGLIRCAACCSIGAVPSGILEPFQVEEKDA
ncbi:hypothetical protein EJB05_25123, partial [Eragrostis curvula]